MKWFGQDDYLIYIKHMHATHSTSSLNNVLATYYTIGITSYYTVVAILLANFNAKKYLQVTDKSPTSSRMQQVLVFQGSST
jgi:hypothetical protein